MYISQVTSVNGVSLSLMSCRGVAVCKFPAANKQLLQRDLIATIQIAEHGCPLPPINVMRSSSGLHLPPNCYRWSQLHIQADAMTVYIPHDSVFSHGLCSLVNPQLYTLNWSDPHTDGEDFHLSVEELTVITVIANEVTV